MSRAAHSHTSSFGGSSPGSLPPFSPPTTYSCGLGTAGASPPYRGPSSAANSDKANPYQAAKKFWKRICFDPALDPTEYTIGFIETVQQPERKSGVEAWSMRLHDRLLELPYTAFVERFCGGGGGSTGGELHPRYASPAGASVGGGGPSSYSNAPWLGGGGGGGGWPTTSDESASDVPYHRIAYFKHGGAVAWESEYHRRRLNDIPVAPAPAAAPAPSPAPAPDAAAGGERSRRGGREGLPPVGVPPPPPRPSMGGGGGGGYRGVRRRSPRGTSRCSGGGGGGDGGLGGGSPSSSDDDGDDSGSGSDSGDGREGTRKGVVDEDLLLLLGGQEEEDEEDEEEEAQAQEHGGGGLGAPPPWLGRTGGGASADGGGADGGGAAPLPQLPEEVWMSMLRRLGVREVCMAARSCRWLRGLAADPAVWAAQHAALWGAAPDPGLGGPAVRRLCRRSQLRAARWLEAGVSRAAVGFPSTTCLQMDESKVVSADGSAVRLWSAANGRRIATLQGHPGRVAGVAFDESLLVSGCSGAAVKLWALDDLRCRRTLRGHEGPVRAVCLLPSGVPVSGGADGGLRLWDAASGAAILDLEAGAPVAALQAHAPSGHLVAAAGPGLQVWDVSTATLLSTLGGGDDAFGHPPAGPAAGGGGAQLPYTCVSYMGDLLAAGRAGEVVLLDPRVGTPVGHLHGARPTGAGGGGGTGGGGGGGSSDGGVFASGLGAIAAAVAAAAAAGQGGDGGDGGGGAWYAHSRGPPCVGVQLDEWKLVTGFIDGSNALHLYDIRCLARGGGGNGSVWSTPLMTLTAPARINTFQFHEQALLAGLDGVESVMWRFEPPGSGGAAAAAGPRAVAAGPAAAAGQAAGPSRGGGRDTGSGMTAGGGGGGALSAEGSFADGGGRKEKKKPAKVSKKQTRNPKVGSSRRQAPGGAWHG